MCCCHSVFLSITCHPLLIPYPPTPLRPVEDVTTAERPKSVVLMAVVFSQQPYRLRVPGWVLVGQREL